VSSHRYSLSWFKDGRLLAAHEPSEPEIARYAEQLAAWYSDDYNRSMMSGSDPVSADEVSALVAEMRGQGSRWFLLFSDGELLGDGDFRKVAEGRAEFTIMIGPRSVQGKGLGTALTILLHAFAFEVLKLNAVYLTIVPANEAGRRCYEKVGYVRDDGPLGRSYAEDDGDIPMSLMRATFLEKHSQALAQIRIF